MMMSVRDNGDMKISKDQARANRQKVVEAASELYRAHGFEGVGVADVMKAAGFTHGGFYNHFDSKEALAAAAVRRAFERMADERAKAVDTADLLARYLSDLSRRSMGRGCPAAALGADAARQSDVVKAEFAAGVEDMVDTLVARLEAEGVTGDLRARALNVVAKMAGALALSRAIPDGDPLAREILDAALAGCLAEAGV